MPDIESKLANLAKLIDGQVVSNPVAVQACVKGIVSGFPVKIEAVQINYPFGISYFLETSHFSSSRAATDSFKLTILPKYARGFTSVITRFLFFERRGQKIELPRLDSAFSFKFDNGFFAKQFAHYPDVADKILLLEKLSHFNELVIKSDAGLYLLQPTPLISVDLDLVQSIITTMANLGQVLFEAF